MKYPIGNWYPYYSINSNSICIYKQSRGIYYWDRGNSYTLSWKYYNKNYQNQQSMYINTHYWDYLSRL